MRRSWVLALLGVAVLMVAADARGSRQDTGHQMLERWRSYYDPLLIFKAEEKGIFSREEFPVLREVNPYYLRGDFNGDEQLDVAFWVRSKDDGTPGIAIIHSTLDTVYVFGAGQARPTGGSDSYKRVSCDTWHLLSQGTVEPSPYGDLPDIGLTEGEPFTFERETLEFVNFGKSAFVFYWANGKYWEFWTAD